MLQNTFIHIPRITKATEQRIWSSGVHTWQDFLERTSVPAVSAARKQEADGRINESIEALKKKDFGYFSNIPQSDHWRLYSAMKDKACFVDIETTGLSKDYHDITLIGIHGNEGTKIFMKDKNIAKFPDELAKYKMLITFNGRCFDLPFIQRKFPQCSLEHYHCDLRFMLAGLGYRGGLKRIEREIGIARDDELEGVDGFEAVRLWHRYQRGDGQALEKLKRYLTADVENLKVLMDFSCKELKKQHAFHLLS